MNQHPNQENEQVGAYVLDALDANEIEAFEAHLGTCSECRAEVAELRQVVAVLPLAAESVQPPAGLRDRILAEVGTTRPGGLVALPGGKTHDAGTGTSSNVPAPVPDRSRWLTKPVGIALSVAAALVLGLGVWAGSLQYQLNNQPAALAYSRQVTDALASGAAVWQVAATPRGGSAHAVLVQPRGGANAYFVVTGLSPVPSSKVYELWLMRGGRPHSVGILAHPGSNTQVVKLPIAATGWQSMGVTVEPAPNGTTAPTTPILLAGNLNT